MSRELNRKQEKMILSDIQRNKVLELENPYKVSGNTYAKLQEENDHETIWQNIQGFLQDYSYNDDDEYYLGKWQSVKYENWLKERRLHNSNAVIRGEQIEKM